MSGMIDLKLPAAFLEDTDLTATDYQLALFFAKHPEQKQWSMADVAELLNISYRTVFRSLEKLETRGYLRITKEIGASGEQLANSYELIAAAIPESTFSEREERTRPVRELKDIVRALADYRMTGYSQRSAQKRLTETAVILRDLPDFSIQLLRSLYLRPDGLWYKWDWRGKQGQSPTPEQVVAAWPMLYDIYLRNGMTTVIVNADGSVYV